MSEEQNELIVELTKITKMGTLEVRRVLIKKKWDKEAALIELEKLKKKNREKLDRFK